MKNIEKRINDFFIGGENFKREFKRQLRLLIIITLGFTIAFTWRQTIFDTVKSIVVFFTQIQESAALSILTSLAITILSLIFIFIASYYLQEKSGI